MSRARSRSAAWAAVALAMLPACGSDKAPAAPIVTLPPAADTLVAPFQDAAGAAPLGDSRWAVVSEGGGMVVIADFGARRVTRLGNTREQLSNPFAVFTVGGDTLWVADWGLRRTTAWAGTRLVGAVPATDELRGALPRARDLAGRFYAAITPPPGRDGRGGHDSAVVVRALSDLSQADTVVRLAQAHPALVETATHSMTREQLRKAHEGLMVLANCIGAIKSATPVTVDKAPQAIAANPASRVVRAAEST